MPRDSSLPAPDDTRAALLDAAERLFAEKGIDRASLRAITREAGANLAAVHYHFGSKEALIHAVIARRVAPLNRERLERLDACLAAAGGPEPEAIVRAFVVPVFEMVRRERGADAFARFVVRVFSDPDEELRARVLTQFTEVAERFTTALARALPALPREEIYWRFHFMVGAMAHTVGLGHLAHRMSGGLCSPLDIDALVDRLATFVAGGLERPAAGAAPTGAEDAP